MLDEFCPRCGERRLGRSSSCRSCGFDFDEVATAVEPPESQPPPGWQPPRKRGSIGHYAIIGVAGLIGLAALANLFGGGTGEPASSQATGAARASTAVAAASTTAGAATPTPTTAVTPTISPTGPPPGLAPDGPTVEARVVRVIDGDTIVVEFGGAQYHLRYIGMDTPESVKPGTPVQPMALAATAANKALVEGKTVLLEKDVSETDRYDRLLRNVWVERDGRLVLVGLELVRTGFAQVTTYPPDVKYVDALLEAERSARAAGVGLWADGVTATPAPTAPGVPVPLVGGNRHPSYSPCLPIVDDLDCADVRAMGKAPVTIKGPDIYRLDRDGDGIGCE